MQTNPCLNFTFGLTHIIKVRATLKARYNIFVLQVILPPTYGHGITVNTVVTREIAIRNARNETLNYYHKDGHRSTHLNVHINRTFYSMIYISMISIGFPLKIDSII